MKKLAILMICLISMVGYAQTDDCGALPRAKVDKKAIIKGEFAELVESEMLSSLKKDGEHLAVFKLYVDCHGAVSKHRYQSGSMTDSEQKWLWNLVAKSLWTAAVFEKNDVTSTVFLTVKITNGQTEIIVQ
jgi:hypothetical protein